MAETCMDITNEPPVGSTVQTRHGSIHTRYELGWYPGPWNWAGLVEQGATQVGSAITLMLACPLDNCDHSLAMHEKSEETEAGSRCRGCRCGEQIVDLADEEWS